MLASDVRLRPSSPRRIALLAATALLAGAALAAAAEVKLFRAASRDDFLAGSFDGISLDPLGALALASRIERLAAIDEPFVFDAAAHPEGWVVGTGNDGRVLLVERDGAVRTLFDAAEPEVFAVWADADGTVYAGASPGAKVYRLAPGEAAPEVVFTAPEATYVWDLARDAGGRLLIATGLPGRLYALAADGGAELLLDSRDRHLRTIAPLPGGDLLLGTAGQGLVLRMSPGGRVRTLHDAPHPEVLAFAVAGDGSAYVALLASEASLVDLSAGGPNRGQGQNGDGEGEGDEQPAVTIAPQGQLTVGSRGAGFTGPRSVLLRLDPSGTAEEIWAFAEETVHALLLDGDALWIGTGEEGRLYRYADQRMVLEHTLEARQITALVAPREDDGGPVVLTTNGAALYHLPGGAVGRGTYSSPVLDAGQVARFGGFFWQGSLPPGSRLELAFRSGMAAEPDATWTDWLPGAEEGEREIGLGDLPAGRYVQWRATLHGRDGEGPRLLRIELSYRQLNLRPVIKSFEVLDPGKILVPSNFNPQSQTFEPWSPSREGIFTTLKSGDGNAEPRLKELWKKGYLTLRWQAEDANEDALRYDLAFRPERDAALAGDDGWLPMAADLEDSWYSFDATVLPDGTYRFRLAVSDRAAEPADGDLEAFKLSPPVIVDHTPPELGEVRRDGDRLVVAVRDRLSPLRDAVYSIDGGEWQRVTTADGLLDGRREELRLSVPGGSRLVLLRLTDAAHNVVTFDLSTATER